MNEKRSLGPRADGDVSSSLAEYPDIKELGINPLLVSPPGAVGLDARIVKAGACADVELAAGLVGVGGRPQ